MILNLVEPFAYGALFLLIVTIAINAMFYAAIYVSDTARGNSNG